MTEEQLEELDYTELGPVYLLEEDARMIAKKHSDRNYTAVIYSERHHGFLVWLKNKK
jgi:hypothetical protein